MKATISINQNQAVENFYMLVDMFDPTHEDDFSLTLEDGQKFEPYANYDEMYIEFESSEYNGELIASLASITEFLETGVAKLTIEF